MRESLTGKEKDVSFTSAINKPGIDMNTFIGEPLTEKEKKVKESIHRLNIDMNNILGKK